MWRRSASHLLGLGVLPGPSQPAERLEFDLPMKLTVKGPNGSAVIDPMQAQNGVEIAIGDKKYSFSRDEFLRWPISQVKNPANGETYYHIVAPAEVSASRSVFPQFRGRVNWGGDGKLLYYSYPENIFILLEAGMAVMLLLRLPGAAESRDMAGRWALADTAEPVDFGERSWEKWLWPGLMAVVFVLAIVIVEAIQPYYFTQDDGLVNVQPGVLNGCRSRFPARCRSGTHTSSWAFPR